MYVVCGVTTSVVYSVEAVWYSGSRLFCLNLFCELTKMESFANFRKYLMLLCYCPWP